MDRKVLPHITTDRLIAWISLIGGVVVFMAIQIEPVLRGAVTDDGSYSSGGNTAPNECGDGKIRESEECDDKNKVTNDGCSASCKVEQGWGCEGEPSKCKKNNKCCICLFQDQGECAGKDKNTCTDTECNDGEDNDGDGKIDQNDFECVRFNDKSEGDDNTLNECKWDEKEQKCSVKHLARCGEIFKEEPWASTCQSKFLFNRDDKFEEDPRLKKCTETETQITGHGQGCEKTKEYVQACRAISRKSKITNLGCKGGGNFLEFYAWTSQMQENAKDNEEIEIIVNQADSTYTCTSFMRAKVTKIIHDVTVDLCRTGEKGCPNRGDTFICKDPKTGAMVTDACCGYGSEQQWTRGATCSCKTSGKCTTRGETATCVDSTGEVTQDICCGYEYPTLRGSQGKHWVRGTECPSPEKGSCVGETSINPPKYDTKTCYDAANSNKNSSYYKVEKSLLSCKYLDRDICWYKGGKFTIDCKKTLTVKEAPLDKKDPTGSKFRYCTAAQINCEWTCTY